MSTIEVEIETKFGMYRGSVPSGKSTGTREAVVFAYKDAKKIIDTRIKQIIIGKKFKSPKLFDKFLIQLDGTEMKRNLGGNVTLALSLAVTKAFAGEEKKELWEILQKYYFAESKAKYKKPYIFSNLINGGAHAHSDLLIQEFMVLVSPGASYTQTIFELLTFYKDLGELLKKSYGNNGVVPLGDEGGYVIQERENIVPINILGSLIRKKKLEKKFALALDVAASHFANDFGYAFQGKEYTNEKMSNVYESYVLKEPLLKSIEDPFQEDDVKGFQILMKKTKAIIVGDDLTTTNANMIEKMAKEKAIRGVIIKPNQIGTILESAEAMIRADINGIKTIVSHRSGETEESFIIHLAKAGGAYGIKIGAPIRERMVNL
jgi:enolase